MKKIYSFMLLAAAMLLSINANADLIEVSDGAGLKTALEETRADGDIIRLVGTDAIAINNAITFNQAVSVTLDLNGLDVTTGVKAPFLIKKGELIVTGMGTMTNNSTADGANMFTVYGTYKPQVNGVYEDTNKDYYTHLLVDEGVSIYVNNAAKGKGVMVQYTLDQIFCGVSEGHAYVTGWGLANGVVVDIKGDIQVHSTKGYCVQVSGAVRFAGECVNPDVYGTVYTRGGKGTTAKPYTYTVKPNWGATTTTGGKRGYKFYVKENNVDVAYIADSSWGEFAPKINLHSTCHLSANNASTGAAAIYAAGYAFWDIRCEAEGSCALAAKSGQITVTDAVLESTATEYQAAEPVTNAQGKVVASGIDTQGSAVIIESNQSYSGGIQITFAGDTRIESQAGYAVEEAVTTEYTGTKVSAITIEGGAFVGGNEGCIVISQPTLDAATGETPTVPITINGGMYEDENDPNKAATNTLISQIINGGNTYTTEVATGNPGTGVAIVITSGTTPGDQLPSLDVDGLYGISHLNPDSSVNLSQVTDGTVFTLDDATGHGDLTLGDVVMNGNNLTIIVNNGITFTAKQLIMNDKARIIVKAGGKLIVTGTQGIIAPVVDNILVEAVEGNMGLFLFNPAVASNKHPNGTVQLVSQGYREGGQYVWQRFGVPAFEGMLKGDIVKVGHSYGTAYKYWNIELDDWANVAADQVMKPFQGFTMTTQTSAPGAKYGMPCALYGNVDAPLEYTPGWNYLANSYTAEIDIESFLQKILDRTEAIIEGAVQINTSSSDNLWKPISWADIEDDQAIQTKLFPMQCFITKLIIDVPFKDTISYETMIWNHRDEENVAAAPARRNMQASDYTKAVIVIANGNNEQEVTLRQSAQFSDEFENGYDVTSYASAFNIYANAEVGNLAQIATDNLMGQTLSIESNKAATFKMTFKNLRGETLAIRDNMTGTVINMTEGEEYFFSVAPGTTADRFEIVEAAKMPTDVEMLEAAPAKKGIYTLVGQYLGENFDVLPAGIYVVNGKKVVK